MNPNFDKLPLYWKSQPAKSILDEYLKNPLAYSCPKCSKNKFSRDSNGTGNNVHACFKCSSCKVKFRATHFATKVMKMVLANDEVNPINDNLELPNPTSASENDTVDYNFCDNIENFCIQDETDINQSITSSSSSSRKRPCISPLSMSTEYVSKDYFDDQFQSLKESLLDFIKTNQPLSQAEQPTDISGILQIILKQNAELKEELSKLKNEVHKLKSKPEPPSQVPSLVSDHGTDDTTLSSPPAAQSSSTKPSSININNINKRPSFAEIAKKFVKPNSPSTSSSIQLALRKIAGVKPPHTTTKAEIKHNFCRVYVQGIERQPIKDLKASLFELRFQLSKIWSIDFIGKTIVEFTISSSYLGSFKSKIKDIPFMKILSNIDPSKPQDPKASPVSAELIKQAFTKRLQKSLLNTKKDEYKVYIKDLAKEMNIIIEYEHQFNSDEICLQLESESESESESNSKMMIDNDNDNNNNNEINKQKTQNQLPNADQ